MSATSSPNRGSSEYILAFACPDRTGIVAAVSSFIADHDGLITEAAHFGDDYSERSFMRTRFRSPPRWSLPEPEQAFTTVAQPLAMEWRLFLAETRCRVLVAVSHQVHCLNSLLHRWSIDALPVDITGVVSNHRIHERMAAWYGLPFHHLPIDPDSKAGQEAALLALFEETRSDLLVLARYMQVLSSDTCGRRAPQAPLSPVLSSCRRMRASSTSPGPMARQPLGSSSCQFAASGR